MKSTLDVFAENLKNRRKELGLTQQKLAELIGYSEKSISKWESGIAIAPSVILPTLAKHLLTDIDSLLYCPEEPSYYLGIDGGGTKTEFLLVSETGEKLASVTLGASNPVDVGINKCFELLSNGIETVCGDIPKHKISVYAGMAGGTTGDNKRKIRSFLSKYRFAKIDNGGDAQNALACALGNDNGTIVIIGTGVIAYTQIDNKQYKNYGFGYLFEEGGSGFAVGRDAILSSLKDEEGSGDKTILTTLLKTKLRVNTILEALPRFYEGGKREIASYAPIVYEAYLKNDIVAKRILEKNLKIVADIIKSVPKTIEQPQKIILIGGQINNAETILPILQKFLENPNLYEISLCKQAPVYGALRLAGLKEL
ncbi:MAG: XRE family transcriptional regulator [Clostridia bacterium]|nr:XRE family transcriptional regulator [Clostridia bacterium]